MPTWVMDPVQYGYPLVWDPMSYLGSLIKFRRRICRYHSGANQSNSI